MPSSTLDALLLVWTIYPDGGGHFALGSPDGQTLSQGKTVEILLGGFWIPGAITWNHNGDYFTAQVDHTVCGLCAGMRVRVLQSESGADVPLMCLPAVQTALAGARTGSGT